MRLTDLVILLAAGLACLFPACLIDAIRNPDEKKSVASRTKACLLCGAVVLLSLMAVNS